MTRPNDSDPPVPYQLRRLARNDAAALMRFYNELSPASKRTFRPLGVSTTFEVCQAICSDNDPPAGRRYDLVAWHADQLVGWCFIWDLIETRPSLGLGIADAHQNRGIGRQLMGAVMDWARRQQIPAVHLIAVQDNRPAVRLYQSFGFTITGEQFDPRDGLKYFQMTAQPLATER